MRSLLITVYFSVFFGCFFGKAQSVSTINGSSVTSIPTAPANISQFEVRGKLITQNSTLTTPTNLTQTGSFDVTARWNSMGNLNSGSQTLNGVRTQTNGRGLAWGHLVPNGGSVSNPFIEWIGNSGASIIPGNLEFNYALSPTNVTRVQTFAIQPVTPLPPFNFNAYAYAQPNCLLGQLQSGAFGGFSSSDKWVGIGNVTTSGSSYIGTRVQANRTNLITGVESSAAFVQFNATGNLQFRGEDVATSTLTEVMSMNVDGRINMGSNAAILPLPNTTNYNLYVSGRSTGIPPSPTDPATALSVGLYARPSAGENLNVAVYGEAFSGAGRNIGIYGTVTNNLSATDYAGFFNGQVSASSYITASDKRLKKDIKTETSAIEKIMLLKPVSYTYDKSVSKWMNLEYERTSHGFIDRKSVV